MKIAIFGAGSVGTALASRFAGQGHDVVFGVPHPSSEKTLATIAKLRDEISPGSFVASTVADAASQADIIFLATPATATEGAVKEAGDLSGKIVVDVTNPVGMTDDGSLGLTLGFSTSAAEEVASWAPGAFVVKAMNQVGDNIMKDPEFEAGRPVMFVCGDDEASKSTVMELVESIGFEAVDAGALQSARLLEPFAMLWIHVAFNLKQGREMAFKLLRR